MLKLGLKITATDEEVAIKLIDPTKKELDTATDDEKMIAQAFKEIFDEKLIDLLQQKINQE